MALLPKVKLKAVLSFPSAILDGVGVDVEKINGAFKFNLAFDDFAPPVSTIPDATHQNVLLWNDTTNTYVLGPLTLLGAAGTVPEAPIDGVQYGRQSAAWTPVSAGSTVSPSNAIPAMDGTATVGTALLYARGDHIHPTDTSRAPLASPALTGNPTAPTPTVGDADTSIATTAFVTTAINGISSIAPSNATPVMDTASGGPGGSALYARGDHAHPTDTSRQAADTDLTALAALTGVGIARRTATTPAWTVGDLVTNAEQAAMSAFTLKGNATSSVASPTNIDIAALTLKASPAGGDFLLLSDQSASGALKKVGIANLPAGPTGISDAPNDGVQYGRQSLGWTAIAGGGTTPSNVLPLMDGTSAPGVHTAYSRDDHVHPTDTTRAPLASPALVGNPTSVTPAPGDNDTSIATTAFVTTAIAGIASPAPSNTNPVIDGAANPGVSALYSRGDHVHPQDAELAALASLTSAADRVPMFTGSGTATTITVTTAARSLLDDTTVPAMLTTLGGQPIDAELTALAGVTSAANQVPMFTGSGTASTITVSPFVQTVLDDTTAAAVQATLGISTTPIDALAANGMQINGGTEIDQPNAGASVAVPAGASAPFLIDGWVAEKSGTNAFTVQQVSSVFPGYNKELKLTVTTAQASLGSDFIRIENKIEGYRFVKAGWGTAAAQPVTVGFWIKSSVAGSFPAQINDLLANSPFQLVTITAVNVAQFITMTIPAQPTWAGSKTNGLGAAICFYAAHSTGINIAATVGNTFEITGLVVFAGTVAITAAQAPLLMRPYDQELALCKRYFYKGVPPARGVVINATSLSRLGCDHPVEMRAVPTLTLAPSLHAWDGSNTSAITLGTNSSTTTVLEFDAASTGMGNAGKAAIIYQNTGEGLAVDARL